MAEIVKTMTTEEVKTHTMVPNKVGESLAMAARHWMRINPGTNYREALLAVGKRFPLATGEYAGESSSASRQTTD